MALPDKAELVERFDEVARQLSAVAAYSRLLTDLHKDDEDAQQMADQAAAALEDVQKGRAQLEIFAGRKALRQVREAEIGCAALLGRLASRDRALSPSTLRQHLRCRQDRDPRELAELLGFYLALEHKSQWSSDCADKVDLLLTRLSQHRSDSQRDLGPRLVSQVLSTSHPMVHAAITDLESQSFRRNLAAIQSAVEEADSLGQLIDSGILKQYRELKHRLGPLLLHPDLSAAILETNVALQRKIQRLNSRTVTGIFSTYQRIFDIRLQGRFDHELRERIDQLEENFVRFEQRIKEDDVPLAELEEFWRTLRGFSDHLTEATEKAAAAQAQAQAQAPPPGTTGAAATQAEEDWLGESVMALLDLLRENDRKGWPPEYISFPREENFQLESREILAFRKLQDDKTADRSLEIFLLKAAALRRTIKNSARKLAGVGDAETYRGLPAFSVAQQAVQLTESFLARYAQAIEQSILDGDVEEAQKLQILRMRLVRESAGIWLQVHRLK